MPAREPQRPGVHRINAIEIAYNETDDATAYLVDDTRMIVHFNERYWVVDDPREELRDLLPGEYAQAMKVLGLDHVVDL